MRSATNVRPKYLAFAPFLLAAAAALSALPGQLGAQAGADDDRLGRWFPTERYFQAPFANPREVRFAPMIGSSDLLRLAGNPPERPPFDVADPGDDLSSDTQIAVAIGGHLPVWGGALWEGGGLTVGVETGVFARFRTEPPTKDLLGTDWIIGMPVHLAHGGFSGRFRFFHRSSHLGDETIDRSGARRFTFSHEAVDLLLAYRPHPYLRVYGGGEVVVSSFVGFFTPDESARPDDDGGVQGGFDFDWSPFLGGRLGLVGGLDLTAHSRTDWDARASVAGGPQLRMGGRDVKLLFRYDDGPSSLGQFFRSTEQFWGLELAVVW